MPHCVMRRPQAGAELGLEDPGERMPRSVGTGFRRETKENNKKTLKTNKVFKESNLPSVRHDSSVRRPVAGLPNIFQSGEQKLDYKRQNSEDNLRRFAKPVWKL